MKKIYYIAMLLSLAATNVAAEEFLPILEPGKEWVYEMEYDYMHDDYVSVKATVLDHAVTIDGVKCSEIEFSPINEEDYPTYSLYCREENGEFSYFYDLTYFEKPGQFIPDVDFNVKEGDRIPMWDCLNIPFEIDPDSWLTVDKVELIEVKGIKRRRISFVNEKGCWVEGIGPSRPLMNRWVNMPIGQNVSEVKSREVYYTGAPNAINLRKLSVESSQIALCQRVGTHGSCVRFTECVNCCTIGRYRGRTGRASLQNLRNRYFAPHS